MEKAALLTLTSVWAALLSVGWERGDMRRYVFSQGTVRVEDGVYRPVVNTGQAANRTGVLVMITPRNADHPKETDSEDKERPDHARQ